MQMLILLGSTEEIRLAVMVAARNWAAYVAMRCPPWTLPTFKI